MESKNQSSISLLRFKSLLESKSTDLLRLICKEFNMKGFSRAKRKRQLIEFILSHVVGDPMKAYDETELLRKIKEIELFITEKGEVMETESPEKTLSKENFEILMRILHEVIERIVHLINASKGNLILMSNEGFYLILTSELNNLPEYVADQLIVNIREDPRNGNSVTISNRFESRTVKLVQKFNPIYLSHLKRILNRTDSIENDINCSEFLILTIIWYIYFVFANEVLTFFNEKNEACILAEEDAMKIFLELENLSSYINKKILVNNEENEYDLDDYCISFWQRNRIKLHPEPWLLFY